MPSKITFSNLNIRQKRDYNFHKIAARLADYGYNCRRLTDDQQGADFIACHIDGKTSLKVKIRTCLTINRKYCGKGIHVAFVQRKKSFHHKVFLYDHDGFICHIENDTSGATLKTQSWLDNGLFHWPNPPKWTLAFLSEY